jgi:HK97 family phage prohead protease
MKTMETRTREVRLKELRATETEQEDKMHVEGYAIVFDEPTDLGFIEVIEKGALDNCDMSDVCMKYNHEDSKLIMARTRNKSLRLNVDDHGLKIEADLIDTQSNRDIYKSQ